MQFKNSKSISVQIADDISEKVLSGALPVGEKIPSVRELAAEMGVNPNTIVRSYSELQMKEIIENQRGIGYFVTGKAVKIINEWKKKEFFETELPEFKRKVEVLNISFDELKVHFNNSNNNGKDENKQ
ncbi:MAG: GntR family transcriptional regulator [Cyclobacteriaceae bacterium]|jgi:GntR family transcriptional regulator|nr:GntR family transcriptional regulator [Cyclobacteriaceae bacterium]